MAERTGGYNLFIINKLANKCSGTKLAGYINGYEIKIFW